MKIVNENDIIGITWGTDQLQCPYCLIVHDNSNLMPRPEGSLNSVFCFHCENIYEATEIKSKYYSRRQDQ